MSGKPAPACALDATAAHRPGSPAGYPQDMGSRPHGIPVPPQNGTDSMNEDARSRFDDLWGWLTRVLAPDPAWILLELGTGPAGFAPFYAERVARVVGTDVTDFSAAYPGMRFVLSDGRTIPLGDESVDMVASHSVLEHVEDVAQTLREVDRVLRVGGYAFLTVSPLYNSASGSHVTTPTALADWEHLDPSHPGFGTLSPGGIGRDVLNGLTVSRLLAAVGEVPWDIHRLELGHDAKPAPPFVFAQGVSPMDAYTREFRLVAHKRFRFQPAGPAVVEPAWRAAPPAFRGHPQDAVALSVIRQMQESRSWRATAWLRRLATLARRLSRNA